jgi:hypothetical protein
MIAQADVPHGEARKREADVMTKEAQMILHKRHRTSPEATFRRSCRRWSAKSFLLIPLDPAISTNPNIVREFRSVIGLK